MSEGMQEQQAAGQVTDQAGQAAQDVQDTAGQTTGQVAGQAQGAVGGLAGGQGQQGGGGSGGQDVEDYSTSDSNTNTVENDKSPKGILAPLLNLDILPSPESDTTTLESGDSGDYNGPAGG